MEERIQKLVAGAGVTSRRKAEEMMLAGRISVNGAIVSALGAKADLGRDRILVDGKPLNRTQSTHYLLLYKPKGVVTTLSDPENRPTIKEFLRGIRERLYPVGRLDYHSEGLLLLTNDGELANRVLHASTALPKTYWVKVSGRPSEEQLERLRQGVYVEGRRTAPAQIRWLAASGASGRERESAGVYRTSRENPWLEVVLIEGRNHQIRKMFLNAGHPVEKLKRVAIGRLLIGALKPGQMRPLTEVEIAHLRQATAKRAAARPAPPGKAAAPASAKSAARPAAKLARKPAAKPAGKKTVRRRERE